MSGFMTAAIAILPEALGGAAAIGEAGALGAAGDAALGGMLTADSLGFSSLAGVAAPVAETAASGGFLSTAMPWMMGGGALLSGLGAMQQGGAQSAAYQAQAYANDYNAKVAQNNALSAGQQANAKEELQRRKFAQLQGEANAGIAESGTGFGGSNADILKQNAINAELDALNIRYEGQQQSSGLLAQSALDRYNASQNRSNAKSAKSAGWMGAGANLLSGLATAGYYAKGGLV